MNRPKILHWKCDDEFEIVLNDPGHFASQSTSIASQKIGNEWVANTNDVLDTAPENDSEPDFPHGYTIRITGVDPLDHDRPKEGDIVIDPDYRVRP